MNKIWVIIVLISVTFLIACSSPNIIKYDEVIYDCGNRLVKGTQIPDSEWDLENGVEVYYYYEDNFSIESNYTMREWFENYGAVVLHKGAGGCKEILRFNNYTMLGPR